MLALSLSALPITDRQPQPLSDGLNQSRLNYGSLSQIPQRVALRTFPKMNPTFATEVEQKGIRSGLRAVEKAAATLFICLLVVTTANAAAKPSLQQSREEFRQADATLNTGYKTLCLSLTKDQLVTLRKRQRDWIEYRDQKAEELLWFNGIRTGTPTEHPEYWSYMTDLTKDRIEFLHVYTGTAVPPGITGAYSDFFDGDLHLEKTNKGVRFSIAVVRGPNAHTGNIEGVARMAGNQAFFTEPVQPGEDRKPCEITFTFIDGHMVKIEQKNPSYDQGMGAYFDGLYFKTGEKFPGGFSLE